jgi:hypothetical protein
LSIKAHHHIVAASAEVPNTRQRLFARYFMAILMDLVVLNLLAQYWSRVSVADFSTSLIAAVLLQLLLQATLVVEHRVGARFEGRSGALWKAGRFLSAWLVLFGSKFVMLGAIDRLFGDAVHFGGPMHGVGPFIVVVVLMLAAEEAVTRVHRSLA